MKESVFGIGDSDGNHRCGQTRTDLPIDRRRTGELESKSQGFASWRSLPNPVYDDGN